MAADSDSPHAIARDAYLYAFAMLGNYQTMYLRRARLAGHGEGEQLAAGTGAPFSLVYRIYGPSAAATRGEWKLPPLEPIS